MMSGQNPHPVDMRHSQIPVGCPSTPPPLGLDKLFGQNWAMDVRTFARIKTVIWDTVAGY